MEKKFELTEETKIVNGATLHRIRALKDFHDVKKGELGGWIEKEKNLSHEGNCWIYNNACIMNDACVMNDACMFDNTKMRDYSRMYGNSSMFGYAQMWDNAQLWDNAEMQGDAIMSGNSKISGNAQIYGNAHMAGNGTISKSTDVICFPNVGSEHGILTVYKAKKGIEITSHRFQGTDIQFLNAVKEKHGLDSKIGKEYSMMIELAGFRILG